LEIGVRGPNVGGNWLGRDALRRKNNDRDRGVLLKNAAKVANCFFVASYAVQLDAAASGKFQYTWNEDI